MEAPLVAWLYNIQMPIRQRKIMEAIATKLPMSGHFILSKSGVFSDLLIIIVPMLLRKNIVVLRLIFSSSKCCSMITILY